MLCDTIREWRAPYTRFGATTTKIARATKFVMESDFAQATCGLAENIEEVQRALRFCRPPFPLTWIEVATSDRERFAVGEVAEAQTLTRRVGFLLESTSDDHSTWHVEMFWSLVPRENSSTHNASMISLDINTRSEGELVHATSLKISSYCDDSELLGHAEAAVRAGLVRSTDHFVQAVQQDWHGEVRFLLAALALLNARNVTETHEIDHTEFNRKRARRGRSPLTSHTTLTIRAEHRAGLVPAARGSGAERAQIRSHFVRGHFKRLHNGLHWWGPFVRGNPGAGAVEKDYRLKT